MNDIERILSEHYDAYYFTLRFGNETSGTVECVINDILEDDFVADGYTFHVEGCEHENIDGDDTDPNTNGGIIDVPTHNIYTINYKKI